MPRIAVSIFVIASCVVVPAFAIELLEQFDSPGKPKERHGIHWSYRDESWTGRLDWFGILTMIVDWVRIESIPPR